MTNKMPPPGFENETRVIPLTAIVPLKPLRAALKQSHKYAQIAASIHEIGMVECPVVVANLQKDGTYYLLDGLLRIEIARELGPGHNIVTVACDTGLKYMAGGLFD